MIELKRRQSNNDELTRSGSVPQRASSSRPGGRSAPAKPLGTIGGCVSTQSTGGVTAPNRTRSPKPSSARRPARKEKTPEELAQGRIRYYKLQELAGDILPQERGLNACMRCRVAIADRVELVFTEGGGADFAHLQTCGSIWLCAPCAAKEAERRRKVMARVNGRWIEGDRSIWMTTYTISHHEYDDLETLLENFMAARKQMREGRQGMALRHDFNVEGTISVLEITWSEENGHHPHVHELVYCRTKDFDADRYEALARSAWKHAAAAYGMSMNEHGFELQRTYGAVQDYVTKYGHQPASDRVWGTESEMVKGHLKRGRMNQHYTPFAMLNEILEIQDVVKVLSQELQETTDQARQAELAGHVQELRSWQARLRGKFREYALAFKGRKQLNPSKGMQPWWKEAEAQIEQEEKAEAEQGQAERERYVLVEFYDDQWNEVVKRRIRGELREEGRTGRPGRILDYLAANGVELYEEQYTRFEGWRVMSPAGMGTVLTVRWSEPLQRWRCSVLHDQGEKAQRWQVFDLVDIAVIAGESSLLAKAS